MKKLPFILLAVIVFTNVVHAQSSEVFKAFRVDVGLGGGVQHSGLKIPLMYMEPGYTVAGRLKVGIRFEQAVLDMSDITSSALTFDYYIFRSGNFRVFAGGGLGLFTVTSSGGCDPGPTTTHMVSKTDRVGALLRTGMDLGHLTIGLEYNFVPSTHVTAVTANSEEGKTVVYNNDYLGCKVGLSIGGGRKRTKPAF